MSARTISIFVPPVSVRVFTQPGSFSEVRPHSRRVRFAPTNGHRRLDRLGQKSAMNGRCRRAYIVTQLPWVWRQPSHRRDSAPRYFSERDWNGEGLVRFAVLYPSDNPADVV